MSFWDSILDKFNKHPHENNQTWGQHCLDALGYSFQAFSAGTAFLVHAFCPFWCQRWGGDVIQRLQNTIYAKRSLKKTE